MTVTLAENSPGIDEQQYRQVLGQYPTGVCVVTSTGADGTPAAMVIGSFTSVSIDPPLIGFFPDRSSKSWLKVAAANRFCVNILSVEQENVCRTLASKDPDKFSAIAHQSSALGSPILDGAVAWIDCELHSVREAGDHFAVLGLVRQLEIAEGGLPLLFFQGGYGGFAPSSMAAPDPTGLLSAQLRLVDRARRHMESLADELSAVCVASARIGAEIVILASAGQPRGDLPATLVGHRWPFVPPTGSVFALGMDEAERDRWIGERISSDKAIAYRAGLRSIMNRGYSIGLASAAQRAVPARLNELADGGHVRAHDDLAEMIAEFDYDPDLLDEASAQAVRLISAPVFDAQGSVAFVLTIHDFEHPTSAAVVDRLADRLVDTTRGVGLLIGSTLTYERAQS
ncbi:MAG: flavin reductase [Sphingomicrobium sp.]